jgi:D-glycero-D-manno-heptose 1,7-bisphosphate phosphatase
LDRDGCLNRERGFVTGPEQLEILPGVPAALQALRQAGFRLAVVTNQSGIARGLYTETDLAAVHAALHRELPGLIDRIDYCPHHPDGTVAAFRRDCKCRKPQPGMMLRAATALGADLGRSFLVGDSARDVLMVRGTAVRSVLVHSGKDPRSERQLLDQDGYNPDHVAADLPAAVRWILEQARP